MADAQPADIQFPGAGWPNGGADDDELASVPAHLVTHVRLRNSSGRGGGAAAGGSAWHCFSR